MGILKTLRNQKDVNLIVEERIYAYVAKEMEAGTILQGLWAKATSEVDTSSELGIKGKYIKLRVEHLKAEGRLIEQFLKEVIAEKEAQEEKATIQPKTVIDKTNTGQPNSANYTDMEVMWWIIGGGGCFIFLCWIVVLAMQSSS